MPHFTTSTRPRVLGFDTPWTGKPNKRPGTKFTVHLDLFHQLAKRCVSSGHIPEASATVRLRLATRRQIQKRRTIPTVYAHRIFPLDITPRSRARAREASRDRLRKTGLARINQTLPPMLQKIQGCGHIYSGNGGNGNKTQPASLDEDRCLLFGFRAKDLYPPMSHRDRSGT